MNKSIDQWLSEYGKSHQNPTNKKIHWICVPLILTSLFGLLWNLSFPINITISLNDMLISMNWTLTLIIIATLFYFKLSLSLTIGMIFISMGALTINHYLNLLPYPLWQTSLFIFVIAWIGQFIGHKIEGKKPSFFKDIQFLLIGPAWLLSFIYKKLNIPL